MDSKIPQNVVDAQTEIEEVLKKHNVSLKVITKQIPQISIQSNEQEVIPDAQ